MGNPGLVAPITTEDRFPKTPLERARVGRRKTKVGPVALLCLIQAPGCIILLQTLKRRMSVAIPLGNCIQHSRVWINIGEPTLRVFMGRRYVRL